MIRFATIGNLIERVFDFRICFSYFRRARSPAHIGSIVIVNYDPDGLFPGGFLLFVPKRGEP
jgi:hypothetical protein